MQIVLTVNGTSFDGWKSIRISAGLDRLARDFDLGITFKMPGNTDIYKRVSPYDECTLTIDGEPILTGYVYAVPIRYDASTVSISLVGRSKTSLLIDCSTLGKSQYKATSAERIITEICAEYGIEVDNQKAVTGTLISFVTEKGEKVIDSLRKIIAKHRIVLTDDGEGRLVIAKIGAIKANDALVLGENILQCDAPNDWKEVYSEYRIAAQSASGAPNDADDGDGSEVEGGFTFERSITGELKPRRVLVIRESGKAISASVDARLQWEKLKRIADAKQRTYTVSGWQQSNGELWKPNQLVLVKDPLSGVEAEMLITECNYLSNPVLKTEITVSDPQGFGEIPQTNNSKNTQKNKPWNFIPKGL